MYLFMLMDYLSVMQCWVIGVTMRRENTSESLREMKIEYCNCNCAPLLALCQPLVASKSLFCGVAVAEP